MNAQTHQPTCHANHLPPYIQHAEEFKKRGVDVLAVLAANDPFVMSGWARFEGIKDKVRLLEIAIMLGAR
jgi:alkyl hydroperoxide reductase 1